MGGVQLEQYLKMYFSMQMGLEGCQDDFGHYPMQPMYPQYDYGMLMTGNGLPLSPDTHAQMLKF